MKLVTIADLKARLSQYLAECERETVVVTKHGKVKAVLLPMSEEKLEEFLLATSPGFWEIIRRSRKRVESEGAIPHEEFWARVEGPVSE